GTGEPHADLANAEWLDPEAVRGRLALAFEGLRQAIGYEPSQRARVQNGLKKLPIRAETLDNIAAAMTLETQITVPTKNGGRPRKVDARKIAARVSHAAKTPHAIECDERLHLMVDGVATAPSMPSPGPDGYREMSGPDLQMLAERIAADASLASAFDPQNGFVPPSRPTARDAKLGEPVEFSIWEIIDVLTDVGLL